MEFNLESAQCSAENGQLEAWVHEYLMSGYWTNPGLSDGLKKQPRWWNGPIEMPLARLTRVVGPEPGMEYPEEAGSWQERVQRMAHGLSDVTTLPPLIAQYRAGELSVRDGNTRLGAMQYLGWRTCWVIIWYDQEPDYRFHSAILAGGGI